MKTILLLFVCICFSFSAYPKQEKRFLFLFDPISLSFARDSSFLLLYGGLEAKLIQNLTVSASYMYLSQDYSSSDLKDEREHRAYFVGFSYYFSGIFQDGFFVSSRYSDHQIKDSKEEYQFSESGLETEAYDLKIRLKMQGTLVGYRWAFREGLIITLGLGYAHYVEKEHVQKYKDKKLDTVFESRLLFLYNVGIPF